jgi:hypothetical protein
MAEKSFFRIKVKETCPYPAVMVKGLGRVTKAWQLKQGKASDYTAYPNLDVQSMVKEGNTFVPAPNADSAAEGESSGTGGSSSNSPAPEAQADETVTDSDSLQSEVPDENETKSPSSQNLLDMSVEQLKAYLSAKGVPSSELRGMRKADLIARAEIIIQMESENT